jgi:hypothetical protein
VSAFPVHSSAARLRAPEGNDQKAAVLTRLRAMQAERLALQATANQLHTEGIPTFSGKGRWQKGTIGHLLAQEEG